MQSKHLAAVLLGLALVGGGAFYGGTIYAKGQSSGNPVRGQFGANGGNRGQFGGRGGGFTGGEVIAKDANSLTLKLQTGGSKIVFFSTSTKVGKMVDGSLDDVTQGVNVMVNGAANSDGSVTASNIQIRPASSTRDGAPQNAPQN